MIKKACGDQKDQIGEFIREPANDRGSLLKCIINRRRGDHRSGFFFFVTLKKKLTTKSLPRTHAHTRTHFTLKAYPLSIRLRKQQQKMLHFTLKDINEMYTTNTMHDFFFFLPIEM